MPVFFFFAIFARFCWICLFLPANASPREAAYLPAVSAKNEKP
jgi:hypothetical protein